MNFVRSQALRAAQDAADELATLDDAYNAMHTRLATELAAVRSSMQTRLNSTATAQRATAQRLERAARALAVRAMQLDNRALELDMRERAVMDAQVRQQNVHVQQQRELASQRAEIDKRERDVLAKEASVKYSTLQQAQLHQWSKRLEKEQNVLRLSRSAEEQQLATKLDMVSKRDRFIAEKERRLEADFQKREEELERREAAADLLAEALQKQRKEALTQIQEERTEFWKQQQRLSAVVSREIDALLDEQAKLRRQFEHDAIVANDTLRSMARAMKDVSVSVGAESNQLNVASASVDSSSHQESTPSCTEGVASEVYTK
ncbi:hypothetical protein BWQ96_09203 [Gracilariopsis chorda]|uniref:Uncharacterized protein n=1 Tax=Gracilariopsis chorda TaxID=448386 RepID=A0A2V3IG85_9FLOR|nr:hypothetical protein BWQ96_09203 [Gracilariopsis chorda]|eukprot:PXF41099.1 hypothetical protein BWQ96_09203 [Gracilariopsis chorda]